MHVLKRTGLWPVALGMGLIFGVLALLLVLAAPPSVRAQSPVTITGTVYDESGTPISGTNVWAEPYFFTGPGGGSTLSDASGRYTLTVGFTNTYRVGAYKLGYASEYYNDTVDYQAASPVPAPATGIDFYLGPGGDVTGTVTLVGNRVPITWASVNASPDVPNASWGIGGGVNATGVYTLYGLPPGTYKLSADAPFYIPQFYNNKPTWDTADAITVTAGVVNGPYDFALQPGGVITGVIFDAVASQPISGIHVFAEEYDTGWWVDGIDTNANGVYTLTSLATGDYRVGVCGDCNGMNYVSLYFPGVLDPMNAARVPVTAPNTTGNVNFGTIPGGVITGTVIDGFSGAPLGNAWVDATTLDNAYNRGAPTDPFGYYEIRGLLPAAYKVSASAPNYITEYYLDQISWDTADVITVATGTLVSNINFTLDTGAVITGTVMQEDGVTPIPGAWVAADLISGPPYGKGAIADANGVYTITGLLDGAYIVRAEAVGFEPEFYLNKTDWATADPVVTALGAPAGNITFTLKAEEGGVIFGRVVKPNGMGAPYAQIEAKTLDGLNRKGTDADEAGFFRLGGLITGTWELVAHPPGDPAFRFFSDSAPRFVPISYTSVITLSPPMTLTRINAVGRVMLPDGTPAEESWAALHTVDFSFLKDMQAGPNGYFGTHVPMTGTYRLDIDPPWYTSGLLPIRGIPITITDVSTITYLGTYTFAASPKHIEGWVVRSSPTGTVVLRQSGGGPGIPFVDVEAWRRGGEGWAHTQTDGSGYFQLDVAPGAWEVGINPSDQSPQDWIYPDPPKLVEFAPDTTVETRTLVFTVENAYAKITGKLVEPDGTPILPWRGWVDARRPDGVGNGTPVHQGGVFTIPVTTGRYNLWIGLDESFYPDLGVPILPPVFITDATQIKNVGVITMVAKSAVIQGRVFRKSDGTGVAGAQVAAWQPEGNWGITTTRPDGTYMMNVVPGKWDVDVVTPPDAALLNLQPPRKVVVTQTATLDFEMVEATGTIIGQLFDPNGNLLTSVDGWAYVRYPGSPEPLIDGPISNGEFSFNVPPGSYQVGIWLPPNSDYTAPGEQNVAVARGQTVSMVAQAKTPAEVAMLDMSLTEQRAAVQAGTPYTVTFTLLPNDRYIRGAFYLDAAKSITATNLAGVVFATAGFGGAWQAVPINPDGTYELHVSAGVWNVGYWLLSPDYINSPPPVSRFDTRTGNFDNVNFTVVPANFYISGRILKPDGSPFPYAWAWAHRDRIPGVSAAIDTGADSLPPDGRFTISVAAGGTYFVGAHAPEELGYIQPDAVRVTATLTGTGTGSFNLPVDLQFKQSDAVITGTVFYHDEAGQRVIGPGAWVWGWSIDGQHTGATVDTNGHYRLNVVSGTVWYIGAVYQVEEGSIFYETRWPPTRVPLTATNKATVDLDLFRAGSALPPAIADTFRADIGWTGILSDGTVINIPPGAMPTTNPTDTVRISITPLVENLPNTLSARPFGFGYAIAAYEDATGKQITDNFNTNVLIIFYYTQQQLQNAGVTEDDLRPAYFSTTTNSWTNVDSFVVYTQTQRITVYIDHFSTWGMTAPPALEGGGGGGGQNNLYLPIVLKN